MVPGGCFGFVAVTACGRDARSALLTAAWARTLRSVELPTGIVTFVFTDIEGSTRLLQRLGARYGDLLDDVCSVLRGAMESAGGVQFGNEGDALFFAFSAPHGALAGALSAQRALAAHEWPAGETIRVRVGLDSGDASLTSTGNYVGLPLHRAARICAAAHGGQVVVSDATRQLASAELPDGAVWGDLGHHRLRDLPDPLRLFEILHADLAGPFPRLRSDAAPGNLPKQRTSFVGRTGEIDAAKSWFREGTAVVTLAGAGGAGKTRLALEVAAELVDGYPHGAWVVDLAAVSEPGQVSQAVATTVDVRDEPGRELEETLVSSLRPKRLLLVLDNCEHLVDECAHIAGMLARSCPGIQILTTSQEALGLPEERVLPVPSLEEGESVELFVDRASVHRPGFELGPSNRDAVIHICRRLDGIPLAIELAAARVAVLTPQQIADRLDDSFRLLSGGSRSALPRQRTLRAAVDWSFQLLQPIEQILLRRLGVFSGGWTLEGAEAVCSDGTLARYDVLDVLGRLVARSLVVFEERDGEARYRLLETIRQYSTEKLSEAGEVAALRQRHMEWFRGLVVDTQPGLTGPDQARLLALLDAQYGNLRGAMEWAASMPGEPTLLQMAAALWRFWLVRGHWSEGRTWLEQALAQSDGADPRTRARALAAAGDLATEQGDHEAAQRLLDSALEIWRDLDDTPGVAKALNHLGNLARARFEFDTARALLHQSLDLRHHDGNERGAAVSLRNLGLVAALQRDFESARTLYEEALPLARRQGDKRVVASLTQALSLVSFTDGEHEAATRLAEEGLAIATELGDTRLVAEHLTVLAAISAAEGDGAGADARRDEALALLATLDAGDAIAWAHTTLGELAAAAGAVDSARLHLAAATAAWRRIGDEAALSRVLTRAGHCACLAGDMDEAAAILEEAIELARRADEPSELASALHAMGEVARYRRDLAFAHRLYEQSLEVARETGWKRLLWGPIHGLAAVAREQGRYGEALDLLRQSIALRPGVGRRLGTATCLDEIAAVASDLGQTTVAAKLLGAASSLRDGVGVPPVRSEAYAELLGRLRAALGDEELEMSLKTGAALSPDEAVALAVEASALDSA